MNKRIISLLLSVIFCISVYIPSNAVGTASFINAGTSSATVDTTSTAAASDVDNPGIVTSKSLSYSGNNSFNLNIEAYVTGQTITDVTAEGVDTDIVIVMDHSNSMTDCIVCKDDNSNSSKCYKVYASQLDKSKTYNNNSGDEVKWCSQCNAWAKPSTNHFTGNLKHTGTTYTPKTSESSSGNQFWVPCQGVTNYIAMRSAVQSFLNSIYAEAKGEDGISGTSDDVDYRVAGVSFAGDSGGDNSTNCLLTFYDPNHPNDGRETGPKIPYSEIDNIDNDDYFKYYYEYALQSVNNSAQKSIIDNMFNNTRLSLNTQTFKGMAMAKNILLYDSESLSGYNAGTRNRVVVVFSDGVPYNDGTYFKTAEDALEESYIVKNTCGADVYAVCLFEGADGSNPSNLPLYAGSEGTEQNRIRRSNRFMHLLSSNYPYARTWKEANSTDPSEYTLNPNLANGESYFLAATDTASLTAIFEKIYSNIQTGGAHLKLGTNAVLKDILTSNFTLNGTPTVAAYSYKGVNSWSKDSSTTAKVTTSGKTISVTNFDFSANYVGADVDNTTGSTTYRGKKLVLTIPIKADTGYKGGNAQQTNTTQSGVYDGNGVIQETLDLPTTDVPTTVTVKKVIVNNSDAGLSSFSFNTTANTISSYTSTGNASGNYLKSNTTSSSKSFSLSNNGSSTVSNVKVGTSFTVNETVNTNDYKVSIKVTNSAGADITSSVATINGGKCTINSVQPDMTITYTNTEIIKSASLVITKNITDSSKIDQDFAFMVTKADDTSFCLTVIIPAAAFKNNSASVTVAGLKLGDYTVKELTEWSNRFDLVSVKAKNDSTATLSGSSMSFTLTASGETLTYTNKRTEGKWLSGDSYAENYFADSGVVRKN